MTERADWRRGALALAVAASAVTFVLRLVLDSIAAEAIAVALLAGVVVFGLAYVANRLA